MENIIGMRELKQEPDIILSNSSIGYEYVNPNKIIDKPPITKVKNSKICLSYKSVANPTNKLIGNDITEKHIDMYPPMYRSRSFSLNPSSVEISDNEGLNIF